MPAPAATPVRTGRVIAVGVLAGVLAGLFGVGGGVILVPALVLLLAVPQKTAHATSLAAIILTAAAAVVPFAVVGEVSWGAAVVMAAAAIVGTAFGARALHRLPAAVLRRAFAVLLLLVALRLVVVSDVGQAAAVTGAGLVAGLAVTGFLAGLLSATLGVGGGVVMVPAMVVGLGFGQHLAEGTSLLVILPTAIVGTLQHQRNGYVRWDLGLRLGLAGICGGLAGGLLAQTLPAEGLQRGFGVFMGLVGLRMLLGRERPAPEEPPAMTVP